MNDNQLDAASVCCLPLDFLTTRVSEKNINSDSQRIYGKTTDKQAKKITSQPNSHIGNIRRKGLLFVDL